MISSETACRMSRIPATYENNQFYFVSIADGLEHSFNGGERGL